MEYVGLSMQRHRVRALRSVCAICAFIIFQFVVGDRTALRAFDEVIEEKVSPASVALR